LRKKGEDNVQEKDFLQKFTASLKGGAFLHGPYLLNFAFYHQHHIIQDAYMFFIK
jgi:hypothetical protein